MQVRSASLASAAAIMHLTCCGLSATAAAAPEAKVLKGHSAAVTAVAFSPAGSALASGSADGTIGLWDAKTGRMLTTLSGHGGAVSAIAFAPDGKTLVSGSNDATVMFWDIATGQAPATLSGHTAKVKCLAFSPDGAWLASGSADKTIRLWNVKTGELKTTFTGHSRGVLCLAFSPDGKTLASGSADESVKIWSVERTCDETAAPLRERHKHGAIVALAYSSDKGGLALATPEIVEVWELAPSQRRYALKAQQKGSTWWCVRYSPRGELLAIGSGVKYAHAIRVNSKQGLSTGSYQAKNNEISLWDAKTGHELKRLKGHQESVRAIELSPNGTLLASGSSDKTVMLWDVSPSLKSDSEPPARVVATSSSRDESDSPLDGDVSAQPIPLEQPDAAFASQVKDGNPDVLKTLEPCMDSLCVDLSQAKYLQPDCCDQGASCATDFVVWVGGGGPQPSLDNATSIKVKGGAPPASAAPSNGNKDKPSPDTADLFRFDPDHAKASWLGYREDVESPARMRSGATRNGGSVSRSSSSRFASFKGLGQREGAFLSRAGKSLALGIREGGRGGGWGGAGGDGWGGGGGHEEHERRK
jgi:dipeptidyl aminopeptidase/acylaminoacyl peptidase